MKRVLAAALFCAALAACGGGKSSSESTAAPAASPSAVTTATTAASPAATTATAAAASVATAAPTATPTPDPLGAVHFTDIKGVYAETLIKQEAAAGVFGTKSGEFKPYAPLTRGTFVRWLVRANNAIFAATPSSQIRLADPSSDQTFVDVPRSNPDFPYIQGMANAGFLIGVDKNHFAPSRNITREELLAIYIGRTAGTIKPASEEQMADTTGLTDAKDVSKPYWGALTTDHWSGLFGSNGALTRIYGSIKTLHPKKEATRQDAAVAVGVFQANPISGAVPH